MAHKTKKAGRLEDLFVGEISLVPAGAVPESDFVITKMDPFVEEGEFETVHKAMSVEGQFNLAYCLELMGEATRTLAVLRDMGDSMPPEAKPAVEMMLGEIMSMDGYGESRSDVDKIDLRITKIENVVGDMSSKIDDLVQKQEPPTEPEPEVHPDPDPKEMEKIGRALSGLEDTVGAALKKLNRALGKDEGE